MTKEMEREVDELYRFLDLDVARDDEMEKIIELSGERNENFFEKRWDSSFFANAARY